MNDEKNIGKEINVNSEEIKMVSFSEIDENGVFREAYGYIESKSTDEEADEYFMQRIKEVSEQIKRR